MKPMPKTMINIASIIVLIIFLTSCAGTQNSHSSWISFPGAYKIDIQQGNVITQKMIDQLHTGMTRSQVQYVMGTPMLEDTFNVDLWYYLYSLQPGNKHREQKTLKLVFENDELISIQSDFKPKHNQK